MSADNGADQGKSYYPDIRKPLSSQGSVDNSAGKAKKASRGLSGGVKKGIATATAVVVGATGIGAALWANEIGPFHHDIPISSTINPDAMAGAIKIDTLVRMTAEEYANSGPKIIENGHLNIPIGVDLVNGEGRTLKYKIEKGSMKDVNDYNQFINVDGLEAGDIILSPIDGEIKIYEGDEGLKTIQLSTGKITSPNSSDIAIYYTTRGLKPILEFEKPVGAGGLIKKIKKGDQIGAILSSEKDPRFNGQLRITGLAYGKIPTAIATTPEGNPINLVSN